MASLDGPGRAARYAAALVALLEAGISAARAEDELPAPFAARIEALAGLANPQAAMECKAVLNAIETTEALDPRSRARALDELRGACWELLAWTHPTLVEISEAAVTVRRNLKEEEPAQLVDSLGHLGLSYHYLTRTEDALDLYAQAAAVARKWLGRGTEPENLASMLELSAWVLMDLGRLDEAVAAAKDSEELRRAVLPPRPDMVVLSLNVRANVEQQRDLQQARDIWLEALRICRGLGNEHRLLTGRIASNLGEVSQQLGRFSEAVAYLNESEEARSSDPKTGKPIRQLANTQHLLARAYYDLGDYPQAIEYYRKALSGYRDWLGEEPYRYTDALSEYATVLEESGYWDAARESHLEALAIRERFVRERDQDPTQEPDQTLKLLLAAALTRFGALQHRLADGGSRASLERALSIQDRELGQLASADRATTRLELSKLLSKQGDVQGARRLMSRCITELEAVSAESPRLVEAFDLAAQLAVDTGQGLRLQHQGLALARRLYGDDNPKTVQLILSGAFLERRAGQADDAMSQALTAQKLSLAHVSAMVQAFPSDQALAFAADRRRALDLALQLLGENPELRKEFSEKVWEAVITHRTLVFDAEIERQKLLRAAEDPDLRALASQLIDARKRFAYLLVQTHGRPGHLVERFREAKRQLTDLEAALAERTRFLAPTRNRYVALQDLQRQMPRGSALISIVRFRKTDDAGAEYLALLSIGSGPPRQISLGDADAVDGLIETWRAVILDAAASSADRQRLERELRCRIWEPLAERLERPRAVLFVPDGMFHLLPLAALPTDEGRYLIELGWVFHYMTSERELLLDPPERRDGSLLALGGVDYNHLPTPGGRPSSGADSAASSPAVLRGGESACRVALPTFFPKLPGTETEVENLASLWARATAGRVTPGRITTLTGVEATEASLRSAVGAHQVVHLATHGFVSGAGCMRPPREGARGIGGLSLGTNPATETKVLFGLALAGANRRSAAENSDQDGILTTEEIVDLDLNGVEWVVLSACDTGLGVIHPGEGVYGLRHTFQVAGAATLIFSLWPVDDSSTRDWMRDLYEARFGRGLTTMDSVNYASLAALLRQRSQGNDNPASWAAFLATGRWN